jgi:hypothetical protein
MTLRDWSRRLTQPTDAASLNVFRIGFGLMMLVETIRFFISDWIANLYLEPSVHFKYFGFGWVAAWPGDGLYWHFAVMGILAAMVATGLLYRLAILGFFVCFAYVFLLEQAAYLNQYYLVLLFAVVLCVVPAERGFSLNALLFRRSSPPLVPLWSIWALRLQVELFLIYAGLVKLNGDWLHGEPLGLWFATLSDRLIFGEWLSEPLLALTASYGVVALHLIGAPLLLWRRTRLSIFVLYVCFHLANATLFDIGLFPWVTLLATLMFFDEDWPRALWRRLGGQVHSVRLPDTGIRSRTPAGHSALVVFFAVFFTAQIFLPLRHLIYSGDVAWTGEGRNFAWRMKLYDRSGSVRFFVSDPATGKRWEVAPGAELSRRAALLLPGEPDLILQYAHYLRDEWAREHGVGTVEVRVRAISSLNGRPPRRLIDPSRDLAQTARTWRPYDWLLPLNEPLPK